MESSTPRRRDVVPTLRVYFAPTGSDNSSAGDPPSGKNKRARIKKLILCLHFYKSQHSDESETHSLLSSAGLNVPLAMA